MSTPLENDLPAFAQGGWTAVELWLTKVEAYLAERAVGELREALRSHGLAPAAAAGQGGLLLSRGPERETHWGHYRRRLGILHELGVPVLIVAADFARDVTVDDYARAAASLAEAAGLAEPHGIRLALEFQKGSSLCASLDTAVALVTECGAGNVGVCLDLFHYYTGPSKFEDLGYLTPENLSWVQVCDLSGTPRELAGDRDRIFPGEGDFQIAPILEHLARIGYDGHVSLEVLNPQLWQISADRVADLGFQALQRVLAPARPPAVPARGGT